MTRYFKFDFNHYIENLRMVWNNF